MHFGEIFWKKESNLRYLNHNILQFLFIFVISIKEVKASEDSYNSNCPTFDSLDKNGDSLVTSEETAGLDIGWIMGDGGQVDREEWDAIKTELGACP